MALSSTYYGQSVTKFAIASETKDWGSVSDGDEAAEEVTVTGAQLGDFALASMSIDTTDITLTATVTAADTVTVILANNTGGSIDLGSGTLYVMVMPREVI
ncbi:MAG: hypothetical protein ACKJRP_04325 [SAR86 cluster bacterium]|jgi:hypothetical protein|tara:strand:- start:42 stop:344 length:303 start_codon:yes stop_codon:yes gene_type:complete